jgi:tRNA (adenine57-N1/adenine58-N1)-methyltransferase
MLDVPFAPGDLALAIDPDGRTFLLRLSEEASLHHHQGQLRHLDVIGELPGAAVRSSRGRPFVVVRPRLLDYVFSMTRKSGIVYPKDAAQIISWADIGPGMRVLEAGVGSGALTLALLRAVGERGEVIGYEMRPDFLELAHANVRAFVGGGLGNLLLRERDVYQGIVDQPLDRVVLDLPEPWQVIPHLAGTLRPGGWLCAYNPSIVQVTQTIETLRASRRFVQVEAQEVLVRPWHVEGQAVRPVQQMVSHTGFITVGRFVEPLS